MKKALILSSVFLACILFVPLEHARAQGPQPSIPATDQGPVVQIQGQSGNGCPTNADPSGGECYSCPAGYTLSGTMCDPPTDPANITVTASSPSVQTTPSSSGAGFVPLAPIPGLTQGVVANSSGLVNFLQNLYKYLIGVAVVLAIVMITWGGIEIAARDSISKQSSGREHITQAILGLVLILAPVLIFTIINPAILNLSVNLPPLNTQWGNSTGTNSSLPNGTVGDIQNAEATPTQAGTPIVLHGATIDKQFSVTPDEAESFVSTCDDGGGKGYYAGGVFGNLIYDGQSCTAQQTTQSVSGSQVTTNTQCTQYKYTAYCSKTTTLSAAAFIESAFGGPRSSLFTDRSRMFPLGTDSSNFVTGCLDTDKGTLVTDGPPTSLTCPANIVDLMKQNGMKSGGCYQVKAHCQINP